MNKVDCCFCNISKGKYKYNEIDIPFKSNDSFFAITSIGALVEGWSLIIPREHQFSMKTYYDDKEFNNFVNKIIIELSNEYGNLIAFEHGSNHEGSITACGTNHGHLHIVPFNDTLLPDILYTGLNWVKCSKNKINEIVKDNEYLFYSDIQLNSNWDNIDGYIHILEKPISQFFRKIIASKIGYPDEYDYKAYPKLNVSQIARNKLV